MSGRDEAAECWLTFYDAHQPALWAYALALTGSSHDAADLLHDVLLSMLRKRPRADHALAYVLRSMRHRAIDANRRAERTERVLARAAACVEPSPAGDSPANAHARSPAQWLSLLSPDQAEIVILRLRAGLDFEAIARIVSRPAGTVTSMYSRALTRLRALAHGGDPAQETGHDAP
jgi:RNA polymerase sigma factor (sigma-70 family)